MACLSIKAGWLVEAKMQGAEVRRVADEEGWGGLKKKRCVFFMCVCVCVVCADLPTLHLLSRRVVLLRVPEEDV